MTTSEHERDVPPPNQNPSTWYTNVPPPPRPDPRVVPPAAIWTGSGNPKLPHKIDKRPWWKFW